MAIAAVAAREGGSRHALQLLALMAEEGISPDRFSLTAAGEQGSLPQGKG